MSDPAPRFRTRFLNIVCRYDFVFYLLFVFEVLLLLLSVLSLAFADLDAETRAVLVLDFVLLGPTLALTVGAIAVCARRS
jgi:hypothetical protein